MLRVKRTLGLALVVPLAAAFALGAVALVAPMDTRRALLNSATLAAGAMAIALPIGTLLAVLLARYDLRGRRWASAALGVLLFLPLYVQLSGWDAALGKLGWISLLSGSMAQPLLAGMRGAIFVHGLAAVPWVALIVGLGLRQVDPAQEEAALLVLPPRQVLWRITLPHTAPFVVAAAIWTVVSTTSEMTVTNIFLMNPGERTYTEQFYMTFSLTADASAATLNVLPGAAALVIVIGLMFWAVVQCGVPWKLVSSSKQVMFSAGSLGPLLTASLWLTVFLLLAVPIGSLISKAGFVVEHVGAERVRSWSAVKCVREVAAAPRRFAVEFAWTIRVAAAAATLAMASSIALAWLARRGPWRALPAIGAAALGMALPGPLVGVALIWLLNHDLPPAITASDGQAKSWLLVLYDETPLAPILAQTIRALPLATLLCWHSFRTLSRDVLDAAALDGLTPWQVLWRVALPQRWAGLTGAWVAGFAVAAGDLAWVHLVTPPGMDLIQRRVFGLVHSGVEEQVAAISLVVVLAYAAVAALVMWLAAVPRDHHPREPA